jgi:hypothetical protein
LLDFSDALVFAFADLYINISTLYTLEAPPQARPLHQAHQFTTQTIRVLDKSGMVPHFPY